MFKAAFPWAEHKEEMAERDYLKTLTTTSQDEVAGNVWIPEEFGTPPSAFAVLGVSVLTPYSTQACR
jgi:hypothetical protein